MSSKCIVCKKTLSTIEGRELGYHIYHDDHHSLVELHHDMTNPDNCREEKDCTCSNCLEFKGLKTNE